MIVLNYLSAIRLSGTDAGDFLHNQVSADVLALAPGESTFACYCEPRGRVLALMLISRHGDDYIVILAHALATAMAARLRMYVMRAKVVIEVLDEHAVVGQQPDGEAGANELVAQPDALALVAVPDSDHTLLLFANTAPFQCDAALQEVWKLTELKRGISWLCTETSGQFLPQMLGFEQLGAINYRKGCYPGQEIVARTHYLGKVKRHPRLLCSPAAICPEPLDKVEIFSADKPYDAVVADRAQREAGGSCLFVITRLDPDMPVDKIEYQGQIASLV